MTLLWRRFLLGMLPALLAVLLYSAPAATEPWTLGDAATASRGDAARRAVQPVKLADHATKRPRDSASLEEFVGIDDDAEQYVQPLPVLHRPIVGRAFAAAPAASAHPAARPNHPVCAAPPTGPPHA